MSYVLLSGGSGDSETGVVAGAKNPVAKTKPTASAAKSAPAIKKFTGKNARDPFKALVVEPVAAAPGPAASSPAPTANPTAAPVGGPATPVTVPSSSYTAPSTPAPSATTAKSTTITMVAVASGDTSARIKVDGKSYEVKPLEQFGTYFKLLNLRESSCGAVQYGDVTFDLCVGQSRTFR
jgi:predicted component of type VI protein secretion system